MSAAYNLLLAALFTSLILLYVWKILKEINEALGHGVRRKSMQCLFRPLRASSIVLYLAYPCYCLLYANSHSCISNLELKSFSIFKLEKRTDLHSLLMRRDWRSIAYIGSHCCKPPKKSFRLNLLSDANATSVAFDNQPALGRSRKPLRETAWKEHLPQAEHITVLALRELKLPATALNSFSSWRRTSPVLDAQKCSLSEMHLEKYAEKKAGQDHTLKTPTCPKSNLLKPSLLKQKGLVCCRETQEPASSSLLIC